MVRFALSLFAGLALFASAAFADTKQDTAVAMVNDAIAHYDQVGRDKAFADFSDKTNAEFVKGEFYVIAADAEKGTFLAHPINPALVNNPKIWDLKDVNNRYIIRDMVQAGKDHPDGGWTEYVWTQPETKKLTPKKTYVKVHDGLLFMVGYYAE